MCGIAGFWIPHQLAGGTELERVAFRMAAALHHRGPDDQGTWSDPDAGLALGHRRLAILDLSPEGHQPMLSADGRYVLVFNGEIYNFHALRRELSVLGHSFRGRSDTEVLLAAFTQWGIVATLKRCLGMFAFALWDCPMRQLHLARDRAGEKPIYYGWTRGAFVFGSELKALRAHPRFEADVDRQAVALLTRYGYIPAPFSIYKNIYKLVPGCVLTLSENQIQSGRTGHPEPYWSLQSVAEAGAVEPTNPLEHEAAERLHALLLDSVRQQMVADVPLGAFLSGGIDSSLIVALMQAQSRVPVKTFSIGFEQNGYDEAPFAKAVASHLGTDHTELYVRPEDLRQIIYDLPVIYDEPFADSSQIPTVALCALARTQVTVSLSGDAGDELFGGYKEYRKAQRIWRLIGRIPGSLRSSMGRRLKSFVAARMDALRRPGAANGFRERLSNLAEVLPMPNDRSLFQWLMSPNRDPLPWLAQKKEPRTRFNDGFLWESFPDLLRRMMYLDFVTYLPDDILVKVDRAAMSVSLETRIPLLDHRIIEYAWSLPNSLKQRRGCGKWLLRRILHQYVPPSLVERPKTGFGVPIGAWLRGPLRPWAEELLSRTRLSQEGFFDVDTVTRKWTEHLEGKRDLGLALWHVLMFEAWLEQQRPVHAGTEETTITEQRNSGMAKRSEAQSQQLELASGV